jgi:hypothetical protein
MLNEIRSFFEKLREEPAPAWPEGVSAIGPDGGDLRAESEHHWRLMMQSVDELEAKIVDLYDAGADAPVAIDLIDEVVAIIRRRDKPRDMRVQEIGRLMSRWEAPSQRPSRRTL